MRITQIFILGSLFMWMLIMRSMYSKLHLSINIFLVPKLIVNKCQEKPKWYRCYEYQYSKMETHAQTLLSKLMYTPGHHISENLGWVLLWKIDLFNWNFILGILSMGLVMSNSGGFTIERDPNYLKLYLWKILFRYGYILLFEVGM